MPPTAADFPDRFAAALAGVDRPGHFHVSGAFDIHPPRLVVEGVGPVSLPLLPVQAEALIAAAAAAPYGRGTETLLDRTVRRTWQIDADRLQLTGARWTEDLGAVLERVRAGFGLAGPVTAELYKLLIYDAGSFFAPHRDTEKAVGMFATLVVVLPGDFSGGALVIRHRGEAVRVALQSDEPSTATFAAFYADCVHEVHPVDSGYRLALIYNLIRGDGAPLPAAPDYQGERSALTDLLAEWATTPRGDGDALPDKLVYPLEHAYSEAELGFGTLKGRDAAVAPVLMAAATAADCDVCLALLSVSETGWAEYGGGHWNHPEFEIGEVTDSARALHDWRPPEGGVPVPGALPFSDDELAPADALADLDDTEPEFSEATGNEGASFERLYQRAALVLWPRARRGAVIAAGGPAVSVPALRAAITDWQAAGGRVGDAQWQAARDLASAISTTWPTSSWASERHSADGHTGALYASFLDLQDLDGAGAFIAGPVAAGAYAGADAPLLARVLLALPESTAGELLTAVVRGNVARRPGASAELLLECIRGAAPARLRPFAPAVGAWLAGLPDATTPKPAAWGLQPQPLTPAHLAVAVDACVRAGPELADELVQRLLDPARGFDPDALLLPALLLLDQATVPLAAPAIGRLRAALLEHLDQRIAAALTPPADWRRAASLRCSCAQCAEINRFLAAPDQATWALRAVEAVRRHVQDSIHRAQVDLDLHTDKRGRPYALVCTKNRASYERQARQRAADLDARERLARAAGAGG